MYEVSLFDGVSALSSGKDLWKSCVLARNRKAKERRMVRAVMTEMTTASETTTCEMTWKWRRLISTRLVEWIRKLIPGHCDAHRNERFQISKEKPVVLTAKQRWQYKVRQNKVAP